MYFVQSDRRINIDLDEYSRIFDFRNMMYRDWETMFNDQLIENPLFVCDLSAALLTGLYKSSYSHKKIFNESLMCCEKIIENLGYKSIDEPSFYKNIARQDGVHVAIVAGCQNDELVGRRSKKAAELCSKSEQNFKVVFSGLRPKLKPGQRVKIADESQALKNHFTDHIKKTTQELPKTHELHFEPNSNNTEANIANFFAEFLATSPEPVHLHVVSSSFHLIRLAEAVGRELKNNDLYTEKINSVNLVGAEALNHKFVYGDKSSSAYLKLMLFDVFRSILVEYPKCKAT